MVLYIQLLWKLWSILPDHLKYTVNSIFFFVHYISNTEIHLYISRCYLTYGWIIHQKLTNNFNFLNSIHPQYMSSISTDMEKVDFCLIHGVEKCTKIHIVSKHIKVPKIKKKIHYIRYFLSKMDLLWIIMRTCGYWWVKTARKLLHKQKYPKFSQKLSASHAWIFHLII